MQLYIVTPDSAAFHPICTSLLLSSIVFIWPMSSTCTTFIRHMAVSIFNTNLTSLFCEQYITSEGITLDKHPLGLCRGESCFKENMYFKILAITIVAMLSSIVETRNFEDKILWVLKNTIKSMKILVSEIFGPYGIIITTLVY